jgi:3-oxoadipate CoA-transferase beta subunit
MDLVLGAKKILVITEHQTRAGEPKIVKRCTYPLTGKAVVNAIFTNLAVIDVTEAGLVVRELAPGVDFDSLQRCTGAKLLGREAGTVS